jgi:hypothetical protein
LKVRIRERAHANGPVSMRCRCARRCQRFRVQWSTSDRPLRTARALRAGTNFLNASKLICPVQPCAKKQSASRKTQISPGTPAIPYRDRHGRWVGLRWTRKRQARDKESQGGFPVSDAGAPDERRSCVRRRRVVLAPVAGVKPAEIYRAQPGFGESSIRRRWRQEEFVSRESAL